MKAKSIKGRSPSEIETAIAESLADGFKPTLAIVFLSVKQDRQAVCEVLDRKRLDIIGATSAGEFIDGHESQGDIVILLLDTNKSYYSIVFEEIGARSLEDATSHLVKHAFQAFDKPALVLITTFLASDGRTLDGEAIVRCIDNLAGPDVSMFGGMAGDDISFTGTWIFTNGKSTDYGIAALVLDEVKIEFHGLAFSGWKPMGVVRTATKTEGNRIYTIDDRPALEMYLHYLGYKGPSGVIR